MMIISANAGEEAEEDDQASLFKNLPMRTDKQDSLYIQTNQAVIDEKAKGS